MLSASWACPSSWRISIVTAVRPISWSGWRTVVRRGVVARLTSMSSKPTTDRSCGHPQPARRGRLHHPHRDLVVEADHGGRSRPQVEQFPARPHARLGGGLAVPHQLRVAQHPGLGQRGEVPADPVVPGVPVRRPGDHPDPAVTELDQVPGDGPGAGEVRRRDRHHAARHGGTRVHHHERVAARGQCLKVGAGLRGKDQDRAVVRRGGAAARAPRWT